MSLRDARNKLNQALALLNEVNDVLCPTDLQYQSEVVLMNAASLWAKLTREIAKHPESPSENGETWN